MDWNSGEPIRGKVLQCCLHGMQMSRDNDPFYFKDEHYPEDDGFYEYEMAENMVGTTDCTE
jgi:hypothetical protein